ncbi:hypothetical protein [Ferruginibacter sp. HRS2-29]|uniref:hypothetical protein n=1 Tax=Ferruginibacter sp. HRS2-29 TaxID=2487334 RepID=UPI0020CB6D06|nr:hypothetical protein [Ferruginibacter sp. HRS2-29]MCP9751330.1 hypothetical protein [Ferruginibacter sp. HRS2-29]
MDFIFVGFDREIDSSVRNSHPFDSMFLDEPNDETLRIKVIHYLEKGTFLTGAMSYIYDNERLPIGNLDYYTDGFVIWPIYYLYYLKKYNNFLIDERLIEHILNDISPNEKINDDVLKKARKRFVDEWSGKY